uniref:Uncharacterized protein n=1 Tax=Globodera pallida TaxID=36090 RepID=A0A183CHS9_GLOPA
MIGVFQLLILLCSLSKIHAVKDVQFLMPFPLELSLSQRCKEKGQLQCQNSCGWASCVARGDYFDNAYDECCPPGYVFKCCAMLPQMKYSFLYKNTAVMFREMEEKCQDKSGFCVCQPRGTSMINGMCCYANGGCGCCFNPNEPTIGKLPKNVYFPDRLDEKGRCGDDNFQLTLADKRFLSIIERRGGGYYRKYVDQWITKRGSAQFINIVRAAEALIGKTEWSVLHDCDFLTKYDRMEKIDERSRRYLIVELKPEAIHRIPDAFECASQGYWMPHLLPDLTTITV